MEKPVLKWPSLNWNEIAILASEIGKEFRGAHVERIRIPARPEFQAGFLKGEFALEFSNRRFLLLSQRPHRTGCQWGEKLTAATHATLSAFELQLKKYLEGTKFTTAESIHGERALRLGFSADEKTQYFLYLIWIPSNPAAALVSKGEVLCSNRSDFQVPNVRQDVSDFAVRSDFSLSSFSIQFREALKSEALEIKRQKLKTHLEQKKKALIRKAKELSQSSVESGDRFRSFGEVLHANLYLKPEPIEGFFVLKDLEDQEIRIPFKPELGDARAHMKHFFEQSKRSERRHQEAIARKQNAESDLAELEEYLQSLEDSKITEELFLRYFSQPLHAGTKSKNFSGKTYLSPNGFTVLVGRSREENSELTFKIGRGNDFWLHVKGKPGAHVIIQIPPGKSAPLETLIFAAQLAVLHSGGKHWGKTEVDYTFRKFVKKIKGSTEVSYSGEKTLIVDAADFREKS